MKRTCLYRNRRRQFELIVRQKNARFGPRVRGGQLKGEVAENLFLFRPGQATERQVEFHGFARWQFSETGQFAGTDRPAVDFDAPISR